MRKTYNVECQRNNVTVSEFFRYIEKAACKKGLSIGIEKEDFVNPMETKKEESELNGYKTMIDAKPYYYHVREEHENGNFIHEIIEFEFDSENKGHGYYYLEVVEVEEETKQENGSEQSSSERIFLENGSVAIQVKVINENTFTTFSLDKNFNYRFGQEFTQKITDMGYTDMNHCIKSLKKRKILHKEVTREELKQIEVNGLLNLGLYRLREHIDVPVDHVCKELQAYGIEFEQSKKKIMDMFENSDEYFETVKF